MAICADATLSEVDVLIGQAFRQAKTRLEFQTKRTVALRLLKDRRQCQTDKTCILGVQAMTLATFGSRVAWVRDMFMGQLGRLASAMAKDSKGFHSAEPSRVGECIRTRIQSVQSRFGEPLTRGNADSGTEFSYAVGGGISWEREESHYRARPGDLVVVCLVDIPRDCPDGDERGRTYSTFHPQSGMSWLLSDSSHSCGGA
jgi:uncharacterized protein